MGITLSHIFCPVAFMIAVLVAIPPRMEGWSSHSSMSFPPVQKDRSGGFNLSRDIIKSFFNSLFFFFEKKEKEKEKEKHKRDNRKKKPKH